MATTLNLISKQKQTFNVMQLPITKVTKINDKESEKISKTTSFPKLPSACAEMAKISLTQLQNYWMKTLFPKIETKKIIEKSEENLKKDTESKEFDSSSYLFISKSLELIVLISVQGFVLTDIEAVFLQPFKSIPVTE